MDGNTLDEKTPAVPDRASGNEVPDTDSSSRIVQNSHLEDCKRIAPAILALAKDPAAAQAKAATAREFVRRKRWDQIPPLAESLRGACDS
jgi:hypothetical protein